MIAPGGLRQKMIDFLLKRPFVESRIVFFRIKIGSVWLTGLPPKMKGDRPVFSICPINRTRLSQFIEVRGQTCFLILLASGDNQYLSKERNQSFPSRPVP
jgi:hypothetical protein